jgi:hypothetical protein
MDDRKLLDEPRYLEDHLIGTEDPLVHVAAVDVPGSGGAHHEYVVYVDTAGGVQDVYHFDFQNGPIKESGANGITHEALLAIVMDRLRCFQKGPYSCKANACALTHIEEAMHWLQQRTIERMRRGVEGTHQV